MLYVPDRYQDGCDGDDGEKDEKEFEDRKVAVSHESYL